MKNDSGIEKTEKVVRNFIPRLLLIVLLFLIFGGLFYVYQLGGLKEYISSVSYLNSLSGEKKTVEYERFYAIGRNENLRGGILAAVLKNGIVMWGIKGPQYFSTGDFDPFGNYSRLYYINGGCGEALKEMESLSQTNPSTRHPKSRFFEDIETNPFIELHLDGLKWRSRIRPGNYIQVLTNGQNNHAVVASVVAEFDGPKNWVICSVTGTK